MLRSKRASAGNDGLGRAESRPSRIGPISLGMKQMGARSAGNPHAACEFPPLRRDRLSWVDQNFIRPETIAAANAAIVAAHSRLDIVRHWGAGEIASADGMRFVAPSSAIHAGPNPKYYGQERGVTWYNMISNQFSGLAGAVIPGTLRDSLVVLALLLEKETELE